jgi:hypothetical protein
MTDWTGVLIVAGAGAAVVRYRLRAAARAQAQVVDISKCGELFATAADWLRTGDVQSAAAVLNLVSAEGWQFAYDQVVVPSRVPRIAAMADRMSAARLLATPAGVAPNMDRLTQIETLNVIANEIRNRTRSW